MSSVPNVIPSAAAELPLLSEKRTHLEYSTAAKTGLNDPATIMHLPNDSKSKAFKKASYGGSNNESAIDYVALKIDDKYVSYQYDKTTKITYFMLYNKEKAEKCTNTPLYHNGIAVELYQTVTSEVWTQIITISNSNSVNLCETVELEKNNFGENRTIFDFSAYKKKAADDARWSVFFSNNKDIGSLSVLNYKYLDKTMLNTRKNPTNDRTGDRIFDRTQDCTDSVEGNTIVAEVQPVTQRYNTPSEPNRTQFQSTEAIIIKSDFNYPRIISDNSSISENNMPEAFKRKSLAVEMMDSAIKSDVNV
ncbi:hypothetical protein BB561_002329 [Smittium simulii]|uniref:Uncharacterized protein n=1 Tax=Smittium simulii TaxID=133385 RepID=A0A2T9YQT5_9FUNG|nr:hypothetical protein BB561_002329 [Smittium simulii]